MDLAHLRRAYHTELCGQIIHTTEKGPNFADTGSKTSLAIATQLVQILTDQGYELKAEATAGQVAGKMFEQLTKKFLEAAFQLLGHFRPGPWLFQVGGTLAGFYQYEHLAELQALVEQYPQLKQLVSSDYLVHPDIVVSRLSLEDAVINAQQPIVDDETACLSPLRKANRTTDTPLLHAIISCKWTLRSDRAQNVRTEALNLFRNRKGHTPHMVAVTAEPMPTRIASLAQGLSDLDCVYHFALPELQQAVERAGLEDPDQGETLAALVSGRRLRDIADLPLDLAI